MLDFLDRLREKPESYRRRTALAAAGVITAIIALVWVLTLDFDITLETETTAAEPTSGTTTPSPFATLREGFSQAVKESAAAIGDIRRAFEAMPTEQDFGPQDERGTTSTSTSATPFVVPPSTASSTQNP